MKKYFFYTIAFALLCSPAIYADILQINSEDEYKKALHLNPKYADIKTRLGIAYRENKQLKESLIELTEATKIDSRYTTALIQLGVTLYSSGKINEKNIGTQRWKKNLIMNTPRCI